MMKLQRLGNIIKGMIEVSTADLVEEVQNLKIKKRELNQDLINERNLLEDLSVDSLIGEATDKDIKASQENIKTLERKLQAIATVESKLKSALKVSLEKDLSIELKRTEDELNEIRGKEVPLLEFKHIETVARGHVISEYLEGIVINPGSWPTPEQRDFYLECKRKAADELKIAGRQDLKSLRKALIEKINNLKKNETVQEKLVSIFDSPEGGRDDGAIYE